MTGDKPMVPPVAVAQNRYCIFCDKPVSAWVPYVIRERDLSDFLVRVDVKGSNLERFGCPHCRSFDRERHLHFYFNALDIWPAFRGSKVLHMAPEPALGKLIEYHEPIK